MQGKQAEIKSPTYTAWNEVLTTKVQGFAASHPETTNLIFSSWRVFTRVLDTPQRYGFSEKDVDRAGGAIWVDVLHATSKMHDILAKEISSFIRSIKNQPTATIS